MNELRARKGTRTILGLLAGLGLVVALSMPAMATHVTPEAIAGNANKTCGQLGAYGFEFKINETPSGFYDQDDSSVSVTPDVDTDFEVTITPAAGNTFSFSANIAVEAVFVKGGNEGGNLYEYDPQVTSDSGLKTPSGQQISHISFCWTDEPQESEAPPSEAPPSEAPPSEAPPSEAPPSEAPPSEAPPSEAPPSEAPPSEAVPSEPAEEPEAPAESEAPASESPREGELGGTPTPAPSGGELPDTAMGDVGQMPATVLSLVLIGATSGMVYVRLARQR